VLSDLETLQSLYDSHRDSLSQLGFNNPMVAIAIMDGHCNYIIVNDTYARSGVRTRDYYKGKNSLNLYPPDLADAFRDAADRKCTRMGFAYPRMIAAGETTYWDWTISPVIAEGGDVALIVFTLLEVTLRVRAEQEYRNAMEVLRQSEQLFSAVFKLAPALITIRSVEDGRYINVNDAWLEATGYSYDEAIDKTADELGIYYDLSDSENVKEKMRSGQSINNYRFRFRNRWGEIRHAVTSADVISIGERPCLVAVTQDLTEEVGLQAELARLERLNLIGQMAGGIGHEIRNPLTAVRGFLQLLKDRHPESQKQFEIMLSEIDRANTIITEFLDLAKTKPEKLVKEDLNEVIATIYPIIQARAFACDMQITLELQSIPETCLSVPEMRQILLNLLNNAIDASPPRSTIFIRTKVLGDEVVLEVEDEGSGVCPDMLPRLGTPFLTTKPHGTGLGLAITYNLVKILNGRVTVRSDSSGTLFTVHIPITRAS
jgi:PAS domain S-box-containing protein